MEPVNPTKKRPTEITENELPICKRSEDLRVGFHRAYPVDLIPLPGQDSLDLFLQELVHLAAENCSQEIG